MSFFHQQLKLNREGHAMFHAMLSLSGVNKVYDSQKIFQYGQKSKYM